MFDYIDKLRKKSDAEKNRFVLIVSISVVTILFILWGVSLAVKISHGDFMNSESSSTNSDAPTLKDTWKGFVEQMNDIIKRTPAIPSGSEMDLNTDTGTSTDI